MEAIKVKGTIVFIGETQAIGVKEFKKREIVLEIEGNPNYPDEVLFEATKDKCDELNSLNIGDEVELDVNLKGRKWTNKEGVDKWFNTLAIWKIKVLNKVDNEPAF